MENPSENEYMRRYPEESISNGTFNAGFHAEMPPQSEEDDSVKLFIGQVLLD